MKPGAKSPAAIFGPKFAELLRRGRAAREMLLGAPTARAGNALVTLLEQRGRR
jgi:hypothetical protein